MFWHVTGEKGRDVRRCADVYVCSMPGSSVRTEL